MGCNTSNLAQQNQNRNLAVIHTPKDASDSAVAAAPPQPLSSTKDGTALTTPDHHDDVDVDVNDSVQDSDAIVDPEIAAITRIQAFLRGASCRIRVSMMVQSLIDDFIQHQQKLVFEALDAATAEALATATARVSTDEGDTHHIQRREEEEEQPSSSPPPQHEKTEATITIEEALLVEDDVIEGNVQHTAKEDEEEAKEEIADGKVRQEEEIPIVVAVKEPVQSKSFVDRDTQQLEMERANDGRLPVWWMEHVPHIVNYEYDDNEHKESIVVTRGTDFSAARSLFC